MRTAAYILVVGAVQSFEGDLGTEGFEVRAVIREGMAPLISGSTDHTACGVTVQAAPELLLLSQRCGVFIWTDLCWETATLFAGFALIESW